MQLVGDVKRSQDRNFARINGQSAGRNLAHALVNVFSQLFEVLWIAVRSDGIGLVVNFDLNSRGSIRIPIGAGRVFAHPRIASASSGSAAATASSMAWILVRTASRSASRRSI